MKNETAQSDQSNMQTYTFRKQLLALTLTLLAASVANANLIVNGSFENHDPFQNGTWGLFNAGQVPGWNPVAGFPQIEIGTGGTYGVTGFDGQDVMELDSTANVTVDQIVGTPGGSYTMSFLYAQRAGVDPSSCTFNVYWNNVLVTSISPTSTAMSLYSTTVTGLANNTLEFVGTGTSDSYGGLVDDVQLNAVPEPTTMALIGLGGLSLLLFRRRQ